MQKKTTHKQQPIERRIHLSPARESDHHQQLSIGLGVNETLFPARNELRLHRLHHKPEELAAPLLFELQQHVKKLGSQGADANGDGGPLKKRHDVSAPQPRDTPID
jgi:hypothetical protein